MFAPQTKLYTLYASTFSTGLPAIAKRNRTVHGRAGHDLRVAVRRFVIFAIRQIFQIKRDFVMLFAAPRERCVEPHVTGQRHEIVRRSKALASGITAES